MISLLSFGPEGWGRLILSATLTTLLLSFAALLVGAVVGSGAPLRSYPRTARCAGQGKATR